MARLFFSDKHQCFVWEGQPDEADVTGALSGWTQTTTAPAGLVRYFTADYTGQGIYNPWAAVPLFPVAEGEAVARLAPFWKQYEASYALDGPADVAPMPPGAELLPFQRAGVAYALERPHTLFGDPMGLGKTVQALAVVNALQARRVLVLCPANVLLQWQGMIRRWVVPLRAGHLDPVFPITSSRHGVHPHARFVLASYDRCRSETGAALAAQEWDVLILDEAHYLRNHDAGRVKAVLGAWDRRGPRGITDNAKRILALTGTPLPNRPRECYNLARLLDHEAIGFLSKEAFTERYNPSRTVWVTGRDGQEKPILFERTGRLAELQARLRCSFMVRREKDKAAPQLPQKLYSVVELSNAETARIARAERLLDIDPERIDDIPVEKRGHIARLRQEMGLAMVPLVVDYIKMLAEEAEDEPFVLFAYHLDVIARLREKLASLSPVVVTGATSPMGRLAAAQRFAKDPQCRLFIGQLTAAGTGIDGLQTRGSRVVFAEASWVPGENEQCVDRLHRVGQTRNVQADFLVAADSLNGRIIARAVEKLRVAHLALDDRAATA